MVRYYFITLSFLVSFQNLYSQHKRNYELGTVFNGYNSYNLALTDKNAKLGSFGFCLTTNIDSSKYYFESGIILKRIMFVHSNPYYLSVPAFFGILLKNRIVFKTGISSLIKLKTSEILPETNRVIFDLSLHFGYNVKVANKWSIVPTIYVLQGITPFFKSKPYFHDLNSYAEMGLSLSIKKLLN